MAERSAPTDRALVSTSCSFPFTTTRAWTIGDAPTEPSAESGASARPIAGDADGSEAPSIAQTPTSVRAPSVVAVRGWVSTTTVMPSDRGVDGGGCTTSRPPSEIPVTERSSPTFALRVRTDCGRPSTTSVTFFWIAR
jgi:hypothetical protein